MLSFNMTTFVLTDLWTCVFLDLFQKLLLVILIQEYYLLMEYLHSLKTSNVFRISLAKFLNLSLKTILKILLSIRATQVGLYSLSDTGCTSQTFLFTSLGEDRIT